MSASKANFPTASKSKTSEFRIFPPILDFKARGLWNRHFGPLSFLNVDAAMAIVYFLKFSYGMMPTFISFFVKKLI